MPIHSIFIPSNELGILEPLICEYADLPFKRARAAKFREVASLLRKLRLVEGKVAAIGLGCTLLGEHGAIILLVQPLKTIPAGAVDGGRL